MKFAKLLIFLLLIYSQSYSQISSIYSGKIHKFALNLSYIYNAHKADFYQLPNVPNCCPHFEDGYGNAFSAYLSYEYSFLNRLSAGIRVGIESLYGKLTATENQYILINEKLELATIGHNLEGKFLNLLIIPNINYQIIYGLNVFAGLEFGLLVGKNFYQVETLLVPENYGTFENGLRIRNEKTGSIQSNQSFLVFSYAGLSYDFPLENSNTFLISPEISFSYQFNSFLKESLWKTSSIRFGITFKYSPGTSLASPIKPQS
jgi:hypothetical protein